MFLKIGVSIMAGLLVVARLVWPDIKIDAITIGLFFVGLLPWLAPLIESMQLPGGWQIKLRDVASAGQQVVDNAPEAEVSTTPDFLKVAVQDPNIALVTLRIEIEKRIRQIAEAIDLPPRLPLRQLLNLLQQQEILTSPALAGLQEIISAGNQAAHGAKVEPALSDWAFAKGQEVLGALDAIVRDINTKHSENVQVARE